MNHEERTILLEAQEMRIQLYREWAEKLRATALPRAASFRNRFPQSLLMPSTIPRG